MKIKNQFRIPAALLPLFFLGCASDQPLPIPGLKESFHTEIAANGAKRFTYSLEVQRRDIPAPVTSGSRGRSVMTGAGMRQGGVRRGGPGRGGLQFDRALEQKLMETGFCREGYFELERSVSAFSGELRGECREGAGD